MAAACTDPPAPGPEPPRPAAQASAAVAAVAPPACPADMALVEGRFCPAADERCETLHAEYLADPDASERCLKFEEPTRCASKKRELVRYCVDRYEWPNRAGE